MSVNEKEQLPVDCESYSKPKESFPRFRRTGCAATSFFELPPNVISKRFSADANRLRASALTSSSGNEQLNLRLKGTDGDIEKKPKTVSPFKIADIRKTNFDLPGQLTSKKNLSDHAISVSKVILPTLSSARKVNGKDQSTQLNLSDKNEKSDDHFPGSGYDEFKVLHSKVTNSEKVTTPRISKHLSSSLSKLNSSFSTLKHGEKIQPTKCFSALFDQDANNKNIPENSSLKTADDENSNVDESRSVAAKRTGHISEIQVKKECEKSANATEKSKQNIFIQNYLSRCMGTQRNKGKDSTIQTISTHPAKKMISKFQTDGKADIRRIEEKEASVLEKALNSLDNKEFKKTGLLRRKFEVKPIEDSLNLKKEKSSLQEMHNDPFSDNTDGDKVKTLPAFSQENKDLNDSSNEFRSSTVSHGSYETVQDSVTVSQNENNENNHLRESFGSQPNAKLSYHRNDEKRELKKETRDNHSEYLVEKLSVETNPYDFQNQTDFDIISFEDFNGNSSEVNEKSLITSQERKISVSSKEEKSQQRKISINMQRTGAAKEDDKTAMLGRIVMFKDSQNLGSGSIKDITNFTRNTNCTQTSSTVLDFEHRDHSISDKMEIKSFCMDHEQKSTEFTANQHSHRNMLSSDFEKLRTADNEGNNFRSKQESSAFDDNLTFDGDMHWDSSMNDCEETFKENFMQTTETGFTGQNFTRKVNDNRSQFGQELDKENNIYSGVSSQRAAFRTQRLQRSVILNQKSSTSTVTRKLRIGQRTIRKTSRYTREN